MWHLPFRVLTIFLTFLAFTSQSFAGLSLPVCSAVHQAKMVMSQDKNMSQHGQEHQDKAVSVKGHDCCDHTLCKQTDCGTLALNAFFTPAAHSLLTVVTPAMAESHYAVILHSFEASSLLRPPISR